MNETVSTSPFGKIAAVVVTYNPEDTCIPSLKQTLAQVDHLIIVDNASNTLAQETLKQFAEDNEDQVLFIINPTNIGLSKAQNIGIARAFEQKAEWIMLLDDDSTPAANMVSTMRDIYLQQSGRSNIAIVVPHLQEMNAKRTTHYITKAKYVGFKRIHFADEECFFVSCAIASGSMIKSSVLKEHGLMNENFFIDYIDTEYALRLISLGYRILAVNNATLAHTLGAQTTHGNIYATNHSPERRYSIYRNRSITWKMYLFKVPHYIMYDIMASLFDIFRITAFEANKWQKLRHAMKGLWHGLFCTSRKSQKD